MGELVTNSFLKFYCGKRVLVTGHTGFKGSWLTLLLKSLGADVMGYALQPEYKNSHYELLGLKNDIVALHSHQGHVFILFGGKCNVAFLPVRK